MSVVAANIEALAAAIFLAALVFTVLVFGVVKASIREYFRARAAHLRALAGAEEKPKNCRRGE